MPVKKKRAPIQQQHEEEAAVAQPAAPPGPAYRVQQQRTPDGSWCIPTAAFDAAFCKAGAPRLLHATRSRHVDTKKRRRGSDDIVGTGAATHIGTSSGTSTHRLVALQTLFSTQVSSTLDANSWAVERDAGSTDPSAFLDPSTSVVGYCSFILQESDNVAAFLTTSDLNFGGQLPLETQVNLKVSQTSAVWAFVGRNDPAVAAEPLRGRPEHTDAVPHDCTWHEQVEGCKIWHLRPTESLSEDSEVAKGCIGGVNVHVEQGDVIIVDTKAWWHCTSVPVQHSISMSYARDLYLNRPAPGESDMVNIEGVWAQKALSPGEVVFTEHDLPEAELQRGSDFNCELVELQRDEDGSSCMAVVTTKSVKAGDFFVLPDDSSDDEEPTDAESA